MKKPSSKIREEIARLQDQLKQAETREAERIGRIALKAGLGEIDIDETELLEALAEVTARFRKDSGASSAERKGKPNGPAASSSATIPTGTAQGNGGEA